MRIAVVSDIHGNLAAFEAVLADLRVTTPDLIFHGGDLPHGGSHPAEIVDRIRDLEWPGVLGNTDEMLFDAQSLKSFAAGLPQLAGLFAAVEVMGEWTRAALGEQRIEWLKSLPRVVKHDDMALVHASPESTWRSPGSQSSDAELREVYGPLEKPIAVYGHLHHPFVRNLDGLTVVNSGSVSLSYDGDARAAYLLIDDSKPTIRRVAYEVDREVAALTESGMPHADWTIRILRAAAPLPL
ncbi:MAG TPA: metallophosphoesterase family protein [Bryobacteraceae bacterium]|nr:metallophosphoesterase family protein [Bryobacteraceae bacterium]